MTIAANLLPGRAPYAPTLGVVMSNIVTLRPSRRSADAPSPDVAEPLMPAILALRTRASEEIRNAVLMLDLCLQHAQLAVARLPDDQSRQRLLRQIESIERLLQLARDAARRL